MIHLPLTASWKERLLSALRNSHQIRIEVQILDRDEKVIGSLTLPASKIIDGEVQVDSTADVSRSLRLHLLDDNHKLHFDADSPAEGALFGDRFIRVWYQVRLP